MAAKKLIISALALISLEAQSQTFSLKQCLDYAIEHNIDLQKSEITKQEQENSLASSKAQMFPSLSFNTNQNITNRPWAEQVMMSNSDGLVTSTTSSTTYNGSYNLSANWTIWNGGRRSKNIELSEISIAQAELQAQTSANNILEQIVQLYVQILYSKESVEVNKQTLEVSIAQRDRASQLVEIGNLSKTDLAQMEAQVANDQYNVVNAQAQVDRYKMQLKQLLELTGSSTEFDIATVEVDDDRALVLYPTISDVYAAALNSRPEIKNSQLNIESAETNIKIAKAGAMPTASLNAGIGTSNNSTSDKGFGEQLKSNWSNSLGLSINVPIYSQRQNKTAISKAKLSKQTSELNLIDQQNNLYNTIEGFWISGTTAQQQFIASKANVESSQTSFDLLNEQFNLGLKNTIELMEGKVKLLSAQQNKLQSKFTVILNEQLLRFYQGEEINL